MTQTASEVIRTLQGRTLVTAESITGGGIGAALTGVSGSSAVYKGGIISYCDAVKHSALGVPEELLSSRGAVCAPVAEAMARGARETLNADIAVSVTGLAGPGGDDYGNPVGTVFIGYADENGTEVKHCLFSGTRDDIRGKTVEAALQLILSHNK